VKNLLLPTTESAIALAGYAEQNLKLLAQQTGTQIVLRGQELFINGTDKQCDRCYQIIMSLQSLWQGGKRIAKVDIKSACHAFDSDRIGDLKIMQGDVLATNRKGDEILAKTLTQWNYVQSVRKNDMTFCIGPAGTGKTYLAAVLAVQGLLNREYERIILTRPAVEAGEKLGFLPGDLQAKVSPFLRPLYDALYEFVEQEKITDLMERGIIEVAPLAYMRGRTLSNAFVIVDEAQNTTPAQMKMVLTRLGFKSKMVVTGDVTQTDLPPHQVSGLAIAQKILQSVKGIAFCYLSSADVVRHPLVEKIVAAYEKYEGQM
jgi:phosphate starvation-inducible protein PhoH and related proteins